MRIKCFIAVLLAAMFAANPTQADVIYNSFDGLNQTVNSFTTTGSLPRNYMADDLSTIATPNAAQNWLVETLSLRIFLAGGTSPTTYNNVTMRVRVYDTFTATQPAGTSVFSDLVSDVTWSLGNLTNTSTTSGGQFINLFDLPYLANNLQFLLTDGQNIGVSVELLENGVANQGLATLLRSLAGDPGLPSIGTSTNGWYRDANSNGIIETSDRRIFTGTNSNMHLIINARAVPEPAMAGMLLLGLVGLGVQRRRKAV